jgi:hypothetical protein
MRRNGMSEEPLDLRIRRIIMKKYRDGDLVGTQDPDLKMLMDFPDDEVRLRLHFQNEKLHFDLGPATAMACMSDEQLERHIWKDQTTK